MRRPRSNRAKAAPKPQPSPAGVEDRGASSAAVEAVARATEACASMEVEPGVSMGEALHDPIHRAQAARWRTGSEPRRVAAILARMMQALQVIRPAWTNSSSSNQDPPVAEPLPVRRVAPVPTLSVSSSTTLANTSSWLFFKLEDLVSCGAAAAFSQGFGFAAYIGGASLLAR